MLIQIEQQEESLYDVGLVITSHEPVGPLRFSVVADGSGAVAEYGLGSQTGAPPLSGCRARRRVFPSDVERTGLAEWFSENPPTLYFADGAMMVGNELYPLPEAHRRMPFPLERVLDWDWQGTDTSTYGIATRGTSAGVNSAKGCPRSARRARGHPVSTSCSTMTDRARLPMWLRCG